MHLSGLKVSYDTLLSAAILDQLNVIRYMLAADKSAKRPKSVLATLIEDDGQAETTLYESGEDFMTAYRKAVAKCQT